MTPDISLQLCGISFANPVLVASGTFSYGQEFSQFYDLGQLGGLVTKTITPEQRHGNSPPRVTETAAGMLNSIGLANPGVEAFLSEKLPPLRDAECPIIVNIAGRSVVEYGQMAARVSECEGVSALELNVSCPNVHEGGIQFGSSETALAEVVRTVKGNTHLPVIPKLSPNVTDIAAIGRAAEDGGADAISLINTLVGMAIDPVKRRPVIGGITAGLSGPAIKPVALAMVYKVSQAVSVPVIGIGGITTGTDVIEFMLAGASLVQVGTANFIDPNAAPRIIGELRDYCKESGTESVTELTGALDTADMGLGNPSKPDRPDPRATLR